MHPHKTDNIDKIRVAYPYRSLPWHGCERLFLQQHWFSLHTFGHKGACALLCRDWRYYFGCYDRSA
ncbi:MULTISPECIES: hypothetical protein [unclassified Gluconobacter]|uniref:hypothetical protein n=1 Tax=unclassified Gluconobacter TaxID=2644261 RepID=UPI00176207A0|nr:MULTISPECIES: hypothetical protein [unclassified Gluconobacter]GFE96732.1 hypothetical protein DmGdi_18050 [Gluconobacter sp. Gdi]